VAVALSSSRTASLLVPWLGLLLFGTVMVGSASVAMQGEYINKHLIYLALAAIVSALVFAWPPTWWHKFYLIGWLVSLVVALLVLVPGVGHEVNGASRWLQLGGFTIQAAEVAKFGLCIYLAGYLSRHHEKIATDPHVLLVPLVMIGTIAGLLVAEPDLGSAVVILGATVGVLFIAGAKLRYFAAIVLVGVAALAALIKFEPYRLERFVTFLDPWPVAFDSGYQLTQALIGFGRGEMWGLGLGEGVQKLDYLPEAHNDFIYSVIAEELGVVGAIVLALVMAYLVLQIFFAARRNFARQAYFAGVIAYFTGLVIGIQFLVNLGVNTGVLPTKGLTLPFVSYGGNSLIISCALMALVLRTTLDKGGQHV